MPTFSDLPVELLLDELLPTLDLPDLLALAQTDRRNATLCADDTFWKRKLVRDFNFQPEATARDSGWKFIYLRGLSNPSVFVWGENSHGRLGLPPSSSSRGYLRNIPAPSALPNLPRNAQIVALAAGGMSFHALDARGRLFVWGTLDGAAYAPNLPESGYSDPSKEASVPIRLEMPDSVKLRSVSCGRLHVTALAQDASVYTFVSWGAPFRVVTPHLDSTLDPGSAPAQVESGWAFSAALTKSGGVFVWWPYLQPEAGNADGGSHLQTKYEEKIAGFDRRIRKGETDLKATAASRDGEECKVVKCNAWEMECTPFGLPPIPASSLPDLSQGDASLEQHSGDNWTRPSKPKSLDDLPKLVKIAALDNVVIGLTDAGHVLRYAGLSGASEAGRNQWEYLPYFSEAAKLRENDAFAPLAEGANEGEGPATAVGIAPPEHLRITHISGHFNTFVAYSTGSAFSSDSTVLMGTNSTGHHSRAKVVPGLQNRGIISVAIGDYHFVALTAHGQVLTWGQYSNGALGLGDPRELAVGEPGGFQTELHLQSARSGNRRPLPPDVSEPAEVRFDTGKGQGEGCRQTFALQVAAAGWHTGALVMELDPSEEGIDDDAQQEQPMPGDFNVPTRTDTLPPLPPPSGGIAGGIFGGLLRGGSPFRVGFAGRGMNPQGRGGARGRGGLM